MMDMTPPPRMMCASCRRPLNGKRNFIGDLEIGVSYHHGAVLDATIPDHEPVPIPIDAGPSSVGCCDFDTAPGPRWTYPCGDFQASAIVGTLGSMSQHSSGGWGACDECHADIEADRWDAILHRLNTRRQAEVGRPFEGVALVMIKALWEGFVEHRTGPATADH